MEKGKSYESADSVSKSRTISMIVTICDVNFYLHVACSHYVVIFVNVVM